LDAVLRKRGRARRFTLAKIEVEEHHRNCTSRCLLNVAVKLEEPDLVGSEARVVPGNIDVMDDLVAGDRVCPG
jgi:hypothetical protein